MRRTNMMRRLCCRGGNAPTFSTAKETKQMKKLMMLTMMAAVGCHAFAMDSLNDGLLAYFPLDGHAMDLSDYQNTAYFRMPQVCALGHDGKLDGSISMCDADGVEVPACANLCFHPTSASCAFWLKANGCYEDKNSFLVFGAGSNSLCVFDNCLSGELKLVLSGNGKYDVPLDISFPFGAWHHWVITFGDDTIKVYLDGKLLASRERCGLSNLYWGGFAIGYYGYYSSGRLIGNGLNGCLDDFCLYNRTLSQDEIDALCGGEVPKGKYRAVRFYPNGGTCDLDAVTVEKGMALYDMPRVERLGFDFCGWHMDSDSGAEVDSNTLIADNIDVYAKWKMKDDTAFYDGCWWYYAPYEGDSSRIEILGVIDGTIPNTMRIPETLNGKAVVSIAPDSFMWREDIYHLELNRNLVNLGWDAFCGCRNLESVLIPSNVKKIGEWAFSDCTSLADVTIEHGVEVLGEACFQYATSMMELVIPSSVTNIGVRALGWNDFLYRVDFKGKPPLTDGKENAHLQYDGESCFDGSYFVEVFVLNDSGWKDENGDRMTQWGFRNVVYGEAFPTFDGNATDQDVRDVVAGTKLENFVRSSNEYYPFLSWADTVCDYDEERKQILKDSPCPWLSYALGLNAPLSAAPTQGALKVTKFSPMSEGRSFDLELAINDIAVSGDAATDNLATVFSVEGCKRLGDGFAADTLTADFSALTDGKVKVRITPKDENADSFFVQAKLKGL